MRRRLRSCLLVLGLGLGPATLVAQNTITFTSADSMRFSVKGMRIATLFGNAKVEHPSGTLTAGTITLNLTETTMSATTATPGDTLSEPVLKRGEDEIRSRKVLYNYETERGKFEVTRVSMEQGQVRGDQVKRQTPHVVFIQDGRYSTCDLPHPHFYIRASRMKIVDEEEVFFTNARLFILDIPYPIPFPVGYIPTGMDKKKSGLLAPTYAFQNQNGRGLGVQGFGWFQYFNDHYASTLSGDLFTSGTFFVQSRNEYHWLNKTRGSLSYSYSRDQGMEPTDPDFFRSVNQNLAWSHNQTINPYASFNMDINLRTAQFFRNNSLNINDRAKTSSTSRIGYNYRQPNGLYTFGANLSQSQNFATNTVSVSGPSANFSLRRLTPFASPIRRPNAPVYEALSLGYNNQFNSRFDYRPLVQGDQSTSWIDALFSPSQYRAATGNDGHIDYGLRQSLDASMPLMSGNKINITGSGRMTEYWYGETIRKTFNADSNRVDQTRVKEFAATRDFSASVSMSTTIYGISMAKIGNLEGFRHTVRPSVSYTWRPDFSRPQWGNYRSVQLDSTGRTGTYSIYERGIFGGPGAGRQNAISLSVGNVFETKLVRRDSTGEKKEQILRLIDNLNASLSYNLAATSFKLSDLSTNLSSNILRNINISSNANFTFYNTDSLGLRIDQYRWDAGRSPLRLTRFNLTMGTQFRQGELGGFGMRATQPYYPETYDPFDQSEFRGYDHGFGAVPIEPLDVAWSLSLSFNYSWQWINHMRQQRTAILNAQSIQVRLAEEWQVGTSIGYDFIQKELTPSQFNVTRQLHCWDMSFVWNPFGVNKYYLFRLTVRQPQMQSLFQKLPGLNNLERTNTPINRF